MMVSLDVDGQTKTLKHRKIIQKPHKDNNLLKNKRMLTSKVGDRFCI